VSMCFRRTFNGSFNTMVARFLSSPECGWPDSMRTTVRLIQCPDCHTIAKVYHLAWSALQCDGCKQMISKPLYQMIQMDSHKAVHWCHHHSQFSPILSSTKQTQCESTLSATLLHTKTPLQLSTKPLILLTLCLKITNVM
jgi:ribosomal protein S27E